MAMAALAGQKTVAAAGTAEALGTGDVFGLLYIKPLSTNTGIVYVGDSTVDSTHGLELSPGDPPVLMEATALSEVYLDVATNGEGVSWLRLNQSR